MATKEGANGEQQEYSTENGQYIKNGRGYDSKDNIRKLYAPPKAKIIKNKKTPAEKIASVQIREDEDNILPELNEENLKEIDCRINKKVLVKKNIIERNRERHKDVVFDTNKIIGEALYSPEEIFKGNKDKPYYTFVKGMRLSNKNGKRVYGVVLLDVDTSKKYFEVVHWHWVGLDDLRRLKYKVK